MIRVSDIVMEGNELAYVTDALTRRELSWHGEYVRRFEEAFANHVGSKFAVTCSSGTAALHLALLAIGIGPGDEVIMPVLTYVATANAVCYCGATPVFVDVRPDSWCLDHEEVEKAITRRTKVILPVQLYGHWPEMTALQALAHRHGLLIVEDSAEGLNARYNGRHAGTFGVAGIFSFYANKTITTGEGGMLVTDDPAVAHRVRLYREQGAETSKHQYHHSVVGYNYRMTNVQAAIGLAQLETVAQQEARRRDVIQYYRSKLRRHRYQELPIMAGPDSVASDWMFAMCVHERPVSQVRHWMAAEGVETRPVFRPMHQLPMYWSDQKFPVAEEIALRGINLPTHAGLTLETVAHVCDVVESALRQEATV